MERVLIGIDEEQASQIAVDWVIERAKAVPVSIKLFSAFDLLVNDPVRDGEILANTKQRIEAAVPGTPVEFEIAERSILEGLAERSVDADLVVVGSHPHRAVRSILTGALPAALISRTRAPLVVVPDDWQRGLGPLVLGVADDDSSDSASVWAAAEAVEADAELVAVHAWRFPVASMDATVALLVEPREFEAVHEELLEHAVRRISGVAPGVRIRSTPRHGDAATELADILSDARLLVLGTRGHGPAVGALLGSVGQHMLRHGRVPVCIVPSSYAPTATRLSAAR